MTEDLTLTLHEGEIAIVLSEDERIVVEELIQRRIIAISPEWCHTEAGRAERSLLGRLEWMFAKEVP